MITELSEKDILDYLMTSEFQEGLTHEEMRLLLFQFRNFFRVVAGKNENLKVELSGRDNKIQELQNKFSEDKQLLISQKNEAEEKLNRLLNRNLTFKERLSGKIKP